MLIRIISYSNFVTLFYEILFFNSAAHKYQKEYLKEKMPNVLIDHEHCGALWIQKKTNYVGKDI